MTGRDSMNPTRRGLHVATGVLLAVLLRASVALGQAAAPNLPEE
jgi:hypothetical protein